MNKTAFDFMPVSVTDRQIMQTRSEVLAKAEVEITEVKNATGFISFRLGHKDLYGIPYYAASEVIAQPVITRLPNTADKIAGVLNWRGNLVTIIDLNRMLGMSSTVSQENSSVIIVESQNTIFGLLVNQLVGSDVCNADELEAPLPMGVGIDPKFLLGLHKGRIAILNIQTILTGINA